MTTIALPQLGQCQVEVVSCNAMRIPAEIAQDLLRSSEGWLGINHPVLTVQPAKKLSKLFWISQRGCRADTA